MLFLFKCKFVESREIIAKTPKIVAEHPIAIFQPHPAQKA
jgi:hypothetical protein